MTICRSLPFCLEISCSWVFPWLCFCAFYSSPVRADRILDLKFWSAEQSELALGGLWEFHAQKLLEPGQRQVGSELLLEISQPWRDFQPLARDEARPLERGSYVLFIKGLLPKAGGYAVRIASHQSMTRVVVAPKYAPERSRRTQTQSVFAVFPWMRTFLESQVRLAFSPGAVDEIWMIIVQRWQAAPDAVGAVPRLQLAEKIR